VGTDGVADGFVSTVAAEDENLEEMLVNQDGLRDEETGLGGGVACAAWPTPLVGDDEDVVRGGEDFDKTSALVTEPFPNRPVSTGTGMDSLETELYRACGCSVIAKNRMLARLAASRKIFGARVPAPSRPPPYNVCKSHQKAERGCAA
jgi:hypothetical protein